jgi:broad specificity phosphatase PhoE
MKLYVARHGQTEWNEKNKVCGISDIKLSEKGIEQAKQLAVNVLNYKIDFIITSPLKRAKNTAEIIADYKGISFMVDDRLFEQNYGVFEGVLRDNLDFLDAKKKFVCKYPQGESMFQVAQRVYNLLDEIKIKYSNKNILIISHGGVCRIIKTYFSDLSNEEFFQYRLGNCELEEYDF